MREIKEIKPLPDFVLSCRFDNGVLKKIDLKPLLDKEAFLPLKEDGNFKKIVNHNYFVEWLGLDIDLSAATLWHLGNEH